jgi:hypothetical protein
MDARGSLLDTRAAEELSHMCFERSHKLPFFLSLLSTHPPIEQRIAKIAPNFVPPRIDWDPKPEQQTKQSSANPSEAFVESVVLASAISSQVGQIDINRIDKTQWQLSLLPEPLKQIARDTHDRFRASDMIFALLCLHNTLSRQQIIEQSSQWLEADERERLVEILPELSPLAVEQQLLLLDLTLPRLKNYSEEQKALLLKKAKRMVDCDRQVSLEEYVIYALLLLSLTKLEPFRKPITRFHSVLPELSLVVATFVSHTAASHEKKRQVFEQLMHSFGAKEAQWSAVTFQPNHFHNALKKLSALSPMLKKPVIDALAEAIQSDGKLNSKEFMLLRAVCEYLDCPIPKLL